MTTSVQAKGRPTVFDQDTVHKLEQALAMDCTVTEACSISGVSRSAYYKHLEADGDFMDRMERAKLYVTIQARHTVAQAIRKGDVKMSQWYLERKRKAEYGPKKPGHAAHPLAIYTDVELLAIISGTKTR